MKSTDEQDLLGKPVRRRRPAFELALQKKDALTLSERAARARWLKTILPKGGLLMPSDSSFVLTEARSAFVDGYHIAATVMASAFAEHWLAGVLGSKGFDKQAKQGLAACIECARRNELWPDYILDRLDHLRKIRNPFVHLKDYSHPFNLSRRSWGSERTPEDVVEEDAKFALETVFALVQYR